MYFNSAMISQAEARYGRPALLRLNTSNFKKAFGALFASGALVAVPVHEEALPGFPVYFGAMKKLAAGEATFNILGFVPNLTYMFVLML